MNSLIVKRVSYAVAASRVQSIRNMEKWNSKGKCSQRGDQIALQDGELSPRIRDTL